MVIALALAVAGAYNYVTRASFCSAAVFALMIALFLFALVGQFKPAQGRHVGLAFRVIPALLLVIFSSWSMGTLATALSTRLRLVPNLLLCGAIFLLGLMSDYLIGRNTKEPWQRTPPPGKEQLWIAEYSFNPKEMANIESWNAPMKIESFGDFIVWTDTPTSPALPGLGTYQQGIDIDETHFKRMKEFAKQAGMPIADSLEAAKNDPKEWQRLQEYAQRMGLTAKTIDPASAWQDANGWKANLADLKNRAQRMGVYSPKEGTWKYYELGDYADSKKEANKEFQALIFRRSPNPPKTPAGGTYQNPLPSGGNWVANAIYAAIPNWQLFWMADALSSQDFDTSVHNREASLPPVYMGYSIAYVICMNVMLTLLAILLFWSREAGKQSI